MARSEWERRDIVLRRLAKIPVDVRREVRAAIEKSAGEIVAAQKRLVSVRTGLLQESISYRMGTFTAFGSNVLATRARKGIKDGERGDPDLTATIVAGDGYAFNARFVEFGTKPHSLSKGVLVAGKDKRGRKRKRRIRIGGPQHPGTKARPFFYPTYRAMRSRAKRAIALAMRRAIRKSKG